MRIPNCKNFKEISIEKSIEKNLENIKSIMNGSSDLLLNPFLVGDVRCNLICLEGMISTQVITNLILHPLTELASSKENLTSDEIFFEVDKKILLGIDRAILKNYGEVILRLMSGFALLTIDGADKIFCIGVQGYVTRGITDPSSEGNIYGAHEGFIEVIRSNMSLLRRRIKSPLLKFELFQISNRSNVDIVLAYMTDRVPKKTIDNIRKTLKNIDLETILTSGYIEPYLNKTKNSFFSTVSRTERPDVLCSKILEGRVGVLIDGTPFALVIPSLFVENFQTLDDYTFQPFYASVLRIIRYIAFFIAIFMPAFYVSVVRFHPDLFNHTLILNLVGAEELAPLPITIEALIVLVFYEIIREAGVRLPRSVGGAVSIVGGLIIGDAAVNAGLISNPLLLSCAIAVTASFVIPNLYQQIMVLRIISVIVSGALGLFGLSLVAIITLVNICSLENQGAPTMSPISPFTISSMKDVFVNFGIKNLGGRNSTVEKLNGVNMD